MAINLSEGIVMIDLSGESYWAHVEDLGSYRPFEIAISPDGRFVVATRPTGSDPGRLFLLDKWREDGTVSGLRGMAWTPDDGLGPTFSADGSEVVVGDVVGKYRDVYSIPDLVHREIPASVTMPDPPDPMSSPDGKRRLLKYEKQWGIVEGQGTEYLPPEVIEARFLTSSVVCGRMEGGAGLFDLSGDLICRVTIEDGSVKLRNRWALEMDLAMLTHALK